MKISKVFLALTLFAYITFLISCSKDSAVTDPTDVANFKFTCTLNGGDFNNKQISYSSYGGSIYSSEEDQTVLTFGTVENDGGYVAFKGNSTGTFQVDDEHNTVVLTIGAGGSIANAVVLTNGTIKVTSYGSVGGQVKGTFSGTGTSSLGDGVIQITNGIFSANRIL